MSPKTKQQLLCALQSKNNRSVLQSKQSGGVGGLFDHDVTTNLSDIVVRNIQSKLSSADIGRFRLTSSKIKALIPADDAAWNRILGRDPLLAILWKVHTLGIDWVVETQISKFDKTDLNEYEKIRYTPDGVRFIHHAQEDDTIRFVEDFTDPKWGVRNLVGNHLLVAMREIVKEIRNNLQQSYKFVYKEPSDGSTSSSNSATSIDITSSVSSDVFPISTNDVNPSYCVFYLPGVTKHTHAALLQLFRLFASQKQYTIEGTPDEIRAANAAAVMHKLITVEQHYKDKKTGDTYPVGMSDISFASYLNLYFRKAPKVTKKLTTQLKGCETLLTELDGEED